MGELVGTGQELVASLIFVRPSSSPHIISFEKTSFLNSSLTMMLSASAKTSLAVSRSSLQSNASRSVGATRTFAKQIKFGVEGRAAMLRGVDMLADAVQVSLFLLASLGFLPVRIPFDRLFFTISTRNSELDLSNVE
jgi:hypothetical protein